VILRPRGPIVGRRPAGCALTCYLLPAMLARLLNRPAPALAQVARFRGLAAGWQPAGAPRAAADAARLVALWQRIDPAATLRAIPAA
jgi:hypothetical protein